MKALPVVLAVAGSALLLLSTLPEQARPPSAAAQMGLEQAGASVANEGAGGELTEASSSAGQPTTAGDRELVSYGRELFQAKGCTACHQHGEVNPGSGSAVGPDLTEAAFDSNYLRAWLGDPASIRPGTFMPNLELSEGEIEALIAFLNDAGK